MWPLYVANLPADYHAVSEWRLPIETSPRTVLLLRESSAFYVEEVQHLRRLPYTTKHGSGGRVARRIDGTLCVSKRPGYEG